MLTSYTLTLASQSELTVFDNSEHCSGPSSLLNQQIRLYLGGLSGNFAIFTVSEVNKSSSNISISSGGLFRLDNPVLPAVVYPVTIVPNNSITYTQAKSVGDGVENYTVGSSNKCLFMAPHGGNIEVGVDSQAVKACMSLSGSSFWYFSGFKIPNGAYNRWHITSTDYNLISWPYLQRLISKIPSFQYGVSFHGFSSSGILIGGSAPDSVKQSIKNAIQVVVPGQTVTVALANQAYSGDSPKNIVNRYAKYGIQIEQSLAVRTNYGNAVAVAVANFINSQPSI